jgi:hypothetical protein
VVLMSLLRSFCGVFGAVLLLENILNYFFVKLTVSNSPAPHFEKVYQPIDTTRNYRLIANFEVVFSVNAT